MAWSMQCKLKNSKKKARDGRLSFAGVGASAQLRFDWSSHAALSGTVATRPQFQLPLASITDQMVSKGEEKVMMKVVTADANQICVLQFYSRQDQQATLTRLLELRGALAAPSAVPLVVLSGVDRGKYLAKDKELRDQYQDLVAKGALRDEDFWKDEQLQERLALEQAENGAAVLPGRVHARSRDAPVGVNGDGEAAARQQTTLVDKEMSEHIFMTQPCVYANFKASVLTGRMSEGDFWADYMQTEQQKRGGVTSLKTAGASHQSSAAEAADESGEHLLGILRGAAMQEKALHERRVASGELQSAASRQAADESRPAAIGMQASVSERHAASAAATAVESDVNVFETPATATAELTAVENENHAQLGDHLGKSQADISGSTTTGARAETRKRRSKALVQDAPTSELGTRGALGTADVCNVTDGDDEGDDEDNAWCAEISNWEPCSTASFRAKRRRLISESRTVPKAAESTSSGDNALLSFTLGGGGPYGIRVIDELEAAATSASEPDAALASERCELDNNPRALACASTHIRH
eukprot:COSAG02_NODE_9662_length_2148_cov_3.649097_1_plen_532_part_10